MNRDGSIDAVIADLQMVKGMSGPETKVCVCVPIEGGFEIQPMGGFCLKTLAGGENDGLTVCLVAPASMIGFLRAKTEASKGQIFEGDTQ
jgi:hypothetical protein